MGLRIGQTQGVLSTLRQLAQSLKGLDKANQRIGSGLDITSAADDPSGLVISQQLRAQISSLGQAVENSQFAANLVDTADGGLSEISTLLTDLRSTAVAAANTGGLSDEAVDALQDQADFTLSAIDRIAATTRFGRTGLLNGNLEFKTEGIDPAIADIDVESARLEDGGPTTFDVEVTAAASAATATGTIAATQAVDSEIRITGNDGTAVINIAAGASTADVESAINSVSDFTGVEAAGGVISSSTVGDDATVELEVLSGDLAGITAGISSGTDIEGNLGGIAGSGNGNQLSFQGLSFAGDVFFEEGTAAGTFSFTVESGGATFQLGTEATGSDQLRVGLPNLNTSALGIDGAGASLSSLRSGGANDLLSNPLGALGVIDAALDDVNSLRGRLGAVVQKNLEPNVRSLGIAIENIVASRSQIEDADLAERIADQVRENLLSDAAIGVLRAANLQAGGVLRLLQ